MDQSQEKYVFEAFKELHKDFPTGETIQGDKPDYIICTQNKKIGVEITQIFIDNYYSSSGLNEKMRENLNRMLGERLCEVIRSVIPFKFILSIDFGEKRFSKNDISRIVSDCYSFLMQQDLTISENDMIDFENYGQLPIEIDELHLFHASYLEESEYSESASGAVPNLTNEHLQIVLDKKDKAINQYTSCDEYWLLIEEGTFRSDSFSNILVDNVITSFERVFLYRHSKGVVISLK